MIKAKIVQRGDKLKKARGRLKRDSKREVQIGYFQEQGTHSSGYTFPELMAIHEFGLLDTTPVRDVFQITAASIKPGQNKDVKSSVRRFLKDIVNGKGVEDNLLDSGEPIREALNSVFGDTSLLQENSERRVREKGRNEPLVDSGSLRDHLAIKEVKSGKMRT